MYRITNQMFALLFESLRDEARAAGLDTSGWLFESGSARWSRCAKIYTLGDHGSQHEVFRLSPAPRDAYNELAAMRDAYRSLNYHNANKDN